MIRGTQKHHPFGRCCACIYIYICVCVCVGNLNIIIYISVDIFLYIHADLQLCKHMHAHTSQNVSWPLGPFSPQKNNQINQIHWPPVHQAFFKKVVSTHLWNTHLKTFPNRLFEGKSFTVGEWGIGVWFLSGCQRTWVPQTMHVHWHMHWWQSYRKPPVNEVNKKQWGASHSTKP